MGEGGKLPTNENHSSVKNVFKKDMLQIVSPPGATRHLKKWLEVANDQNVFLGLLQVF